MQAAVYFEPEDVNTRLAALGLDLQSLLEVGTAGILVWSSSTANDPPMIPGVTQWGRMVRTLREKVLPAAWTKSDDGNYSVVISPMATHAIAVSSGCQYTGRRDARPTTKAAKGPNTAGAVSTNQVQLDLFPETLPASKPEPLKDYVTWILLFHRGDDGFRMELSLPASMGVDGFINGWSERILLPVIPLDPIDVSLLPEAGPDFDVEVKKRA